MFFRYLFRFSLLAAVGLSFDGRNNLKVEKVSLSFPNLPSLFNGYRIVQLSDLHASFWVTEGYLDEMADRTNQLLPDMVVVTGDFLTGSVNEFWKKWVPGADTDYIPTVEKVLGKINTGVRLAVLGNHDQGTGEATVNRLVKALNRVGFSVLRNASVPIAIGSDRIHVAGTDDAWYTSNLSRAIRDIPEGAFTILLSHNPDIRTDIRPGTDIDLTLCGHTHGGQIRIPYVSEHVIPISDPSRYLAGLVREPYGYTYVNRGIGTLVFPLRLGAPPEITSITLRKA
jgi:predicted MPP superfamily phosphohydrolase